MEYSCPADLEVRTTTTVNHGIDSVVLLGQVTPEQFTAGEAGERRGRSDEERCSQPHRCRYGDNAVRRRHG